MNALPTKVIDQKLSWFTDEEIYLVIELIRVDRPLSKAILLQKRYTLHFFLYLSLFCAALLLAVLGLFGILSRSLTICSGLISCVLLFLTLQKRAQRLINDSFIYHKVDYICDYLRTHSPYRGVKKTKVC